METHGFQLKRLKGLDIPRALSIITSALSLDTGTRVGFFGWRLVASRRSIREVFREPILKRQARYPFGASSLGIDIQVAIDLIASEGVPDATKWIHQLIEACNEDSLLEARALNAASLIDVLRQHLESIDDFDVGLSRANRRAITTAARDAALAKVSETSLGDPLGVIVPSIRENVEHITDVTFRRLLTLLMRQHEVLRTDEDRQALATQVAKTRNELVHNGRFASGDRSDWYDEYFRLVWMAGSLLARAFGDMNGYKDPPHRPGAPV
jgi:hypothetical protein